jgi:ABC-type branched-subunit amino acid transport system substrate-binding protein
MEKTLRWKRSSRRGKRSGIAAALALLAVTTAACGGSGSGGGSAHSPLTFDVYSNFTGAQAAAGEDFILPGARMGIKAVNDAGGILGHPVTLISTDGLSDPADAVPTAQRLLAQHSGLTAIIGIGSDIAPVVVPIFNSHHIAMMSAAGTPALDRNTYQYFYRETQPDSLAGTGVADSALAKGYKRIVMIFDSSGTSQSDAVPFLTAFKRQGGTVLANITIQPDQPSYRTEVAKMASLHPQALVTEEDPQTAGTLFSDMKQLGVLGLPVIGGPEADTAQYTQALAQAVGGYGVASKWFYEAFSSNASTPGFSELQKLFTKLYGKGQPNPGNRINYDGTIMLALAMTAAKSTNPTVFVKYIKQVSGHTGTRVTTYAQGVAALKAGKKIYYDGAEGVYNFNQYLWPSEPFVLWGLSAQGAIHPDLTLSASQVSASFSKG